MAVGNELLHVEKVISYTFQNKNLLCEALRARGTQSHPLLHPSSCSWDLEGNRRIAMLGDSILRSVVLFEWYTESSDATGVGTQFTSRYTSNDHLASVGKTMGIDECIFLAPGMYAPSEYMVATAMEAIIGAVYLDGGFDKAKKVVSMMGLSYKRDTGANY